MLIAKLWIGDQWHWCRLLGAAGCAAMAIEWADVVHVVMMGSVCGDAGGEQLSGMVVNCVLL